MSAPVIALRDVHKHYAAGGQDVHALRGIDLEIAAGEFVAVMGPSGSGKTTLLEILGCLSRPSSGSYTLQGTALEDIGEEDLARVRGRTIGFIFQAFNLLPRLTLAENVELPLLYQRVKRADRRERALGALARVGLAHRAHHRPVHVSGGERQRAAIARALVVSPSLVLGDEPTGNLDSETGNGILDLLGAIHGEGGTVVVVTHDASIAARAARCLRIRDGRIEEDVRRNAP
ncbi:MAG TPA: ABC transporter ATP-binding protein [Myxococcota bacterium]|nr:ABC transporter ATP-binding protein [Myxococcota bacterium]